VSFYNYMTGGFCVNIFCLFNYYYLLLACDTQFQNGFYIEFIHTVSIAESCISLIQTFRSLSKNYSVEN
jgi:hypothetical protein